MNITRHKYRKGKQCQYGDYIYRDDDCLCGCIRRTQLNDVDKEEIEGYTMNDIVSTIEPLCTIKKRTIYRPLAKIKNPDISNNKHYKKLIQYIRLQIFYNEWICVKNFYSAEDILMDVYIETKDKDLGIDDFIKEINSILYKRWNEYRKNTPNLYKPYLDKRRQDERLNRENLNECYLLKVVQMSKKYNLNEHISYNEIRDKYKNEIIETKQRIELKRAKSVNRNEN